MTPERLAEITAQAASLTYAPTKRAAEDLLAEIARLRALVESAYREGWDDSTPRGQKIDMGWKNSEARAALDTP